MSKIEIKNLTFGYDGQAQPLFKQANFLLDSQWKLGLVGRNGRGKTTLLRLLQGELPYQGTIQQHQQFSYFPQSIRDQSQLTNDVLAEISTAEQWQIEREMRQLGLAPDLLWRPFSTLSGGEQTKVLLAVLFTATGAFPLIDEPTNHLDLRGRQQVAAYLQQQRQGFIVVSHDRHFLNQVTDHTLAIEKSQISSYQGNFATYEAQKQLSDSFEQAQNSKLKKDIGRLKQTAAEKAKWSQSQEGDKYGDPRKKGSGAVYDTGFIGARAARTMKRSKHLAQRMETEISEKEQLLQNIEQVDPLTMAFQPSHQQRLLTVAQLQLGYAQPLFQPLNFELLQGQRLALIGPNGAGKSTVVHQLLHQFNGTVQGTIQQPQQLKISYVRQNYTDNRGMLTEFATTQGLDYTMFLNNLHKLGMPRDVFNTPIELMSMGQRKKVELAKSLSLPAELYIWDEPLNYLDVFNQEQLEQLILAVQPTMLLIEHDQAFIDHVATQVVTLKKADN
ncbi:ribosomal protection-like ABC-F family protein [Loigolactobacillus zhaoyuanensis]|uniref:ribosomal protection-like ABC-F family protein n=1 Tax=Loigolactobacillus zhaoyuanensis TaxID=2486017 RepID=UPI000F7498EE|nr:ABC-F type ribosomal protection protein [Loigolactobacillus zhaoyuanensis]